MLLSSRLTLTYSKKLLELIDKSCFGEATGQNKVERDANEVVVSIEGLITCSEF